MVVKKAFVKRKTTHATFMYIPETDSKVVSLRIPTWLPKVVAVVLVLLLLGTSTSLYMLNSINDKYGSSKDEINNLAAVNNSQKQEIVTLQNEALKVQQQLEENAKALDDIRKIVGLKQVGTTEKKEAPAPKPEASSNSQSKAVDETQQVSSIHTSYTELLSLAMSQREVIDSSVSSVKKQVAYINAKPTIAPVDSRITAGYGTRKNPFTNRGSEFHPGIDFAGDTGDPIKATGNGVVIFAGWQSGYGKVVIISHGYGFTTLYGHNSKLLVEEGDKVKKGQVIAKMGSTGRSTGSHCHYEVRLNGSRVNPRNYF